MWTARESVLTHACARGAVGGHRSCIRTATRPRRLHGQVHQDTLLVRTVTYVLTLVMRGWRATDRSFGLADRPAGRRLVVQGAPLQERPLRRRPPASAGARHSAAPDGCAAPSPRRSRAPLPRWSQRCARTTTDTNAQQTRASAILDASAEERMRFSPRARPARARGGRART